jgi:molybdate transport system substrate-binding protein
MGLYVLSAGAAKGVVDQLRTTFKAETNVDLHCTFGPVGVIRQHVVDGALCDVVVLSEVMMASLTTESFVLARSVASVGAVRTGIAARAGDPVPDVSTPAALRATLLNTHGLYIPDPERSTAGDHIVGVLHRLGIYSDVQPRLQPFANGADAMAHLGESTRPGDIGCTQVTEILYTDGVMLVDSLPGEFGLTTVYVAAVSDSSTQPVLAQRLVAILTSPASRAIRDAGGFEQ